MGVTDNAKSVDVSGSSNDIYACSGTSKYDTSFATCGDKWKVDAMRTVNLTVGYMFDNGLRVRGTIRNLEDERAPLADEYTWGFVADQPTAFRPDGAGKKSINEKRISPAKKPYF